MLLLLNAMSMLSRGEAIHQILPSISYGDAISNQVRAIQVFLRAQGYKSEIFAENITGNLKGRVHYYHTYRGNKRNIVMYHLSIGSPVSLFVRSLPDTRVIVYHNITPSHYFQRYSTELTKILRFGRQELRMLMPDTALALGDSAYNEQELKENGFRKTGVLPIIVDTNKFAGLCNKRLYKRYNDGWTNILFVGRISPNKCQDDLIRAFHVYSLCNPKSRLLLVGSWYGMEGYKEELDKLTIRLGVQNVHFVGTVDLADLATYYQLADVFVSMSEHEGFMVPLVEAMHFRVPIVAYAATAVPETLGRGGVLLTNKDYEIVAGVIDRLVNDAKLRDQISAYQAEELKHFSPVQTEEKLLHYLTHL